MPRIRFPNPNNLFKYYPTLNTDPLRLVSGVLGSTKVRFTPPEQLHDPFEGRHGVGFIRNTPSRRRVLRKLFKERGGFLGIGMGEIEFIRRAETIATPAEMMEAWGYSQGHAIKTWRIFCLSRIPPRGEAAIPLWAYFAGGHTGFVLEFDRKHPWINYSLPGETVPFCGDVKYRATRVSALSADRNPAAAAFTKSRLHKHEKEYRIIRDTRTAKDLDRKEADGLVRFPPKALLSVTIGARMPQRVRDRLRSILKKNPEYKHVRLYYASVDPIFYRVNLSGSPPSLHVFERLNRVRRAKGRAKLKKPAI